MGCCEGMAVFFFNLLLFLFTLPVYLFAKLSLLLAICVPLRPNSCRSCVVLKGVCLGWRCALAMSCWVRKYYEGIDEYRSELGSTGLPAVVIANHASFLDTILLVAMTPLSQVSRVKMFVSGHLTKMPVLGPLCEVMGHLAVPFKAKSADGSHEVDKEKMSELQHQLEEHVSSGGIAAWFPEGTMNRGNVQQLQTFRAGGFTLAVNVDVEIWCAALQGQPDCWPANKSVGGRPSDISARIFRLCESSHALLRERGIDLLNQREASMFLANYAHDQMQNCVVELVAQFQSEQDEDSSAASLIHSEQ